MSEERWVVMGGHSIQGYHLPQALTVMHEARRKAYWGEISFAFSIASRRSIASASFGEPSCVEHYRQQT